MQAKIRYEKKGNIMFMYLEGDFNGKEENDSLLNAFKTLADDNDVNIIIDLADVFYLNSASIGVFLSGNAIIKKKQGKIVLFNASDYLENLFNVTKLNLVFKICEDEECAVKVFEKLL